MTRRALWYVLGMRVARLPLGICVLLGASPAACSRDANDCHERMTAAQAIVAKVDGKSVASLQASLSAVNEAHAACEKAQLGTERELLTKAKNELTAQLDLLEARASRKKVQAPSADELARLVKQGDPSCPKGQAYKPKDSKSEVRCTGPQIVDMSAEALKAYYGDRRFRVKTQEAPAELRAELGSELYVFAFDKLTDDAPRCVTAYAAPGLSWQEVTARLTGTSPEKLKLGTPARSGRGELPFKVEHETDKPTIRLGRCP
jgi:hypothetical protein